MIDARTGKRIETEPADTLRDVCQRVAASLADGWEYRGDAQGNFEGRQYGGRWVTCK